MEVVVAVGVFAILAVMGSLLLFGTLRGAKKAAAVVLVRNQGAYAMGVMTASLRFTTSVGECLGNRVTFASGTSGNGSFSCETSGQDKYLASSSGRLTSPAVAVVDCSNVFRCDAPPPQSKSVTIVFGLTRSAATLPEETARVDFESQVGLRN